MKHAGWKTGMIALLLTGVVGCSNSASPEAPTQQSATSSHPDSSTSSQQAFHTIKISVDEKKAEELLTQFKTQPPTKVVTVSVAITEILNELGVTPVGVPTTSSKLPASLDNVPRIGTSHQPDLEQVAKLQPDVILGPTSIQASIDKKFKPAALPTAYLPVDSIDELKLSTVVLGRLFKQEEKATAFLQSIMEKEKTIIEATKGKSAPKVLFLFGSSEALMVMNENTFVGSLARNLGASNVASDVLKQTETYVPLNMESIVAANPDVILLVAHGDPNAVTKKFEEDVKKNGAWEKLSAFKNGKMKALDYSTFGIASLVKVPAAYEELANILYNE
ncbi:iron complex transport system substrate-binding protein [Brevibacillus sp. AG162]|uniref:helical backbone metal receptor n=1 Tax=Brevibacillus sp. AG162 TaxID=2572910 RepID=UPI00114F767C|nr:helical backbone metal receptor [Brevibacillus sp. AG162]TQK74146.1 iron complex transport system substrate-binding protein [Brevibacillus sp. AG162]